MKRWKKIALGILGSLVLVIGAAAVYMATYEPEARALTELVVDQSPESVARGKHLSTIYGCWGCHSDRDWTHFAGPQEGKPGKGGFCYHDAPGTICASNLTPDPETGIGSWTDDEILRAIREGVDRENKALFPIMPYEEYRHMSDEDAHAIIAYLRSLEPVSNVVPAREVDFPVSFFIKRTPKMLKSPVEPPDAKARGKYLAKVALCELCHTPVNERHESIAGKEFSGGRKFEGPFGTVVTSNLTPHITGLAGHDAASFAKFFDVHRSPAMPLEGGNTVMMWRDYATMTDSDLAEIFGHLQSVPAIENRVE